MLRSGVGRGAGSEPPHYRLASVHAAQARADLGLACFHAGDSARAEQEFSRAPSENPSFPDLGYFRARIFERSGRPAQAVEDLERALADHPRDVEAHLLLAVCLGQHLALARARRLRGDLAGASAAYRAAMALAPGYGAAALELAGVELALGRPAAAEALLDELARRHPEWADAHALLGRTRLLRGDAAGAEPALRGALLLNPHFGAARGDLGWALLAQARGRDADAEFARALDLDPIHALPRQQLAWRELRHPAQSGAA